TKWGLLPNLARSAHETGQSNRSTLLLRTATSGTQPTDGPPRVSSAIGPSISMTASAPESERGALFLRADRDGRQPAKTTGPVTRCSGVPHFPGARLPPALRC